jgi:hypothetical protein
MKRLNAFVLLIIFLPNFNFPQNYSWTHTGGPNGGIVGDMVINSSDEIFAGVYNFKAVNDSVFIDAAYPNLRISANGGSSWVTTSIRSSPFRSAILYENNTETIFIHGFLNQSKIFYTSNYGQSFSEILAPTSISSKNSLALNSFNDLFYSSTQGDNQLYGIYHSNYPYQNWIKLYSGITYSIEIDYDNIIYTSVNNGVISSEDNGNNWKLIFNENTSRAFAHDLKIDDNILFIATNSYGLYELQNPTNIVEENNLLSTYQLYQNYPNPYNPTTKIKFTIPRSELVKIKVYDILGKEIQILLNEYKQAGVYEVEFDASNLPSGIYFYRMISGDYLGTKKMILLR